jgi:hypothetical protein
MMELMPDPTKEVHQMEIATIPDGLMLRIKERC